METISGGNCSSRDHNRISGQNDVNYLLFEEDLSQTFNHLFGVFLMRIPHTALVAGLRPSTDLDSMNFLAFYLLRVDDMSQPEDEDTRGIGIREHCGVPRVLLIEAGQMIKVRLVVCVDAVVVEGTR